MLKHIKSWTLLLYGGFLSHRITPFFTPLKDISPCRPRRWASESAPAAVQSDPSSPAPERLVHEGWHGWCGWWVGTKKDIQKVTTRWFPGMLVGGFSPPLWKMMEFVSWDDELPNIWTVIIQSCSKPPTSMSWFITSINYRDMHHKHEFWETHLLEISSTAPTRDPQWNIGPLLNQSVWENI